MKKGKIIIISAPSGTGKSTIINELTKNKELRLQFSVSATNRSPRTGEVDGVNYHFLSDKAFKEAIATDAFVEYEEVYPGRFYGTLKSELKKIMDSGNNVILDIDVKGGLNVKRQYPDALSIFIQPPSIDVLRERLIGRGTDSIETINQRVSKAEYELSFAPQYDKSVVNDNLNEAVAQTTSIILEYIKQ